LQSFCPADPQHPQLSYFNWKTRYDGMQPVEMRSLKQFEDENAKLKMIVADRYSWMLPGFLLPNEQV